MCFVAQPRDGNHLLLKVLRPADPSTSSCLDRFTAQGTPSGPAPRYTTREGTFAQVEAFVEVARGQPDFFQRHLAEQGLLQLLLPLAHGQGE